MPSFLKQLFADYGMLVVLLLLILLFSLLTIQPQAQSGGEAGQALAEEVLAAQPNANVLIVGRPTADDRAFNAAAAAVITNAGATVVGNVIGSPPDARKAIETALADGKTIDAVIANTVTAQWTIYDRFEEITNDEVKAPVQGSYPSFIKRSNILGVANQTSIIAIMAIGMTMVIITAGIDLSVGSLLALASVICTLLIRTFGGEEAGFGVIIGGMFMGMGVCALAGIFNGFLLAKFEVPPFISTLAMMLMASGLAFTLSNGQSIGNLPESFRALAGGTFLGIPNPVVLMILLYILAHVIMTRTTFGRHVYAIGGNEEAARLSGVNVTGTLLIVYTICGALAGLGGILLASQLGAGDPKYGLMYELYVIAAVVVGGTSLMGGSGKIFGTLIGAFIIAVINNGMNLTNVTPFYQKIVLGAVLLAAILIDTIKKKRA